MSEAHPPWRKIFNEAVEIADGQQRTAYLAAACGADAALLQRIEGLIQAHADAGGFLGGTGATGAKTAGNAPGATVLLPTGIEQPGDRIGRYKLLQQIGEGGCGVVYMADQEEPVRRRVALKVIKLGMDTKSVIARFEAERQALALMDHPNIARVLDAGATDTGRPYFVMELVKGVRITDYCDQNNFTTPARLALFTLVCQAIQHAHQKGIIHRDIKPSNILVTLHDGVPVPKVIDFGIAKATDQRLTEKTLFTAFEAFMGTPAYMSPEQAEMSGLDIDTRSDIYSLGVLLYQLLTGKTPFEAKDLMAAGLGEMRRTLREQEPARPSTRLSTMLAADLTTVAKHRHCEPAKLASSIRGDLDWIVMKALEKDRTRRYDTANGLAMDIARHLKNEPVVARPPSPLYRFQKMVRRNTLAFAAVSAVTVALVSGLALSSWLYFKESKARLRAVTAEKAQDQARQEAENARAGEQRQRVRAEEGELSARQQLYLVDMNLTQLALNGNDRQRAVMLLERNTPQPGQKDLRGWEWRYLWQSARSDELFTLGYHSNVVTSVAISPNGRLVVSGSLDDTLMVWDLGTRRRIATLTNDASIHCVVFSPDGETFVVGDGKGAKLWHTGRLETIASWQPGGLVRAVAFSPDGRQLAMYSVLTVTVWNLETKAESFRIPADRLDGSLRGALAYSPDGQLLAVGESTGHIHLFDAPTGRERAQLPGHRDSVTGLAFLPGSRALVSTSWDRTAKLWDIASGTAAVTFSNHTSWANSPALSPDGKTLVTASADQTVKLWDTETGRLWTTLRGHLGEVWTAAFHPDGQRIATGGKDDAVRIWSAKPRPPAGPESLPGFKEWRFSSDNVIVAALDHDGTVGLADVTTLEPLTALVEQQADITSIAFSPDGKNLATGDIKGLVQIWNPTTRRVVRRLAQHGAPLHRVHFSADGRSLCSLDSDGYYKCLVVASGEETVVGRTPGPAPRYDGLAFSPDLRFVAFADLETVVLFDLVAGTPAASFRGHREILRSLTFSPDGRWLASASEDATVRVWDMALQRQTALLRGHRNGAYAVSFSPDGRRLASAGGEGLIRLWDTSTWQEAGTLETGKRIERLFFSADSHRLVARAASSRWLIWEAPSFEEIAADDKNFSSFTQRLKLLGGTPAKTANGAQKTPRVFKDEGRLAEFELLYHDALARAGLAGSNNPSGLEIRIYQLADVLFREGKFADAELLYREILRRRQTRLNPEDEDRLRAVTSLGRLLADWAWAERTNAAAVVNRAREGASLLRDCLAIRLRGTNASFWRTADLQSRLGGALLGLAVTEPALSAADRASKFTEAEAMLLQSQSALQQSINAEMKYQRDAFTRLIRFYEVSEKPASVAEWQQKLETFDKARSPEKPPAKTGTEEP